MQTDFEFPCEKEIVGGMQGLFLFQSPPQKFLWDSCIRIYMSSLLVEILGKLTDCLTSLG